MHAARRPSLVTALFVGLTLSCATSAESAAPSKTLPPYDEVKALVEQYFAKATGYEQGDIVSRKQVKEVLDQLEQVGWTIAKRNALEQQTLADDSFLITQLRSPAGKKFMRKVSALPLAYDRLDRLAQLPQGRSTVERLVRGPDGYKLLEYMIQEPGGKSLSKMLSKDGHGNFSKPTGKVYSVDSLLKELRTLHAEASSAARRR
jgi:hypothetical protein